MSDYKKLIPEFKAQLKEQRKQERLRYKAAKHELIGKNESDKHAKLKALKSEHKDTMFRYKRPFMADMFEMIEESRGDANGVTPFNDDVKMIKDVVYKEIDGKKLYMDIYLPIKRIGEKSPVVFDIPGGGWMIHNRLRRGGYARLYAALGAVVCVIDHRLTPSVVFPQNLCDVIDAVNFLTTIADEYNMDLNDLTITGDSSGGHLSACLACASSSKEYGERLGLSELKVEVKRCIFISGAFSFETMYHIPCTHTLIVRYFSATKSRKAFRASKIYKESDPYNYITSKFPPSYNNGGAFDAICPGEAKRMASRLSAAGVDNECQVGKNLFIGDHCYVLRLPFEPARRDMYKLLDWYVRQEALVGVDMSEGMAEVKKFLLGA